jgi:hypothetical protein
LNTAQFPPPSARFNEIETKAVLSDLSQNKDNAISILFCLTYRQDSWDSRIGAKYGLVLALIFSDDLFEGFES